MANKPISMTEAQRYKESLRRDIERQDFPYEYPYGDLHPKSELSKFIIDEVMDRVRASQSILDGVKPQWKQMDWTLNAYMPASDADRLVKQKDVRKPVNVVVPMTLASRDLLLTYMDSAFLSEDSIYKYQGRGAKEKIIRGALMERVISVQNAWFKEGLRLTHQWADAFTYGIGVVSPQWRKHKAQNTVMKEVDEVFGSIIKKFPSLKAKAGDALRYLEERVVFEGNRLENIDPYKLILDPNTPIMNIQDAEFVGWMWCDHSMQALRRETDPEEYMFNGKYIQMLAAQGKATSEFWDSTIDGRNAKQNLMMSNGLLMQPLNHGVHNITLLIDLVPKEWGLSDRDRPQKWMITISGDMVVRQCHPLDLMHGMFPVCACAPNSTGYDIIPVSHLMTTFGLQTFLDYLINSRITSVRKNLNDMLAWDPEVFEEEDMMNPEPGKLIRIKRGFFGEDSLANHIFPIPTSDVTAGHMNDAMGVLDMMRQANSTSDIAMGDLSKLPERPTAAGINAAQQGALSRLQHIAKMIGVQSMRDIAFQEAYNTVQFMGQEVSVPILGRYEEILRREYGLPSGENQVPVSPFDLDLEFDVTIGNGTMKVNENLQAMGQVLQSAMVIPAVQLETFSTIDIPRMFLQYARKSGFENVQEFIKEGGDINAQVLTDHQVQQDLQAGNIVPLGQGVA